MPRIDHDEIARLFAVTRAPTEQVSAKERSARTRERDPSSARSRLHPGIIAFDASIDATPTGLQQPRVLERLDRVGGSDAASDYVGAHADVLRFEAAFVEGQPELSDKLLGVDHAYQRAWTDLRARRSRVSSLPALSGPQSAVASLEALRGLLAALQADPEERFAVRHLAGPLGKARPWMETAARPEIEADLKSAREARARAFGPAIEASPIEFGTLFTAGPVGGDTSWMQSVVRVQRAGAGPGSGVFIAPNRVLTAAHVVAPEEMGTPDVRDLTIFVPSRNLYLAVGRVRVHPQWTNATDFAADYALLDVVPVSGLGLVVRRAFGASGDSFPVSRYGFPTDGSQNEASGAIDFAGDMFESADLEVPAGASGGGLIYAPSGNTVLVGITTYYSSPPSGGKSPVGLPIPTGLEEQMEIADDGSAEQGSTI